MAASDREPTAASDRMSARLLEHAGWIRRLAVSLVGDGPRADDVVQDTWLAALRARPSAERPLRPWLRTVLRNAVQKSFRAESVRRQGEVPSDAAAPLPGPDELGQRLEAERALTDELAQLAEPYRSTLLLRYYEDLAPIEIARRLGLPDGTVRWRLRRGLELLRERLDGRTGGDRGAWCALLLPLARPAAVVPTAGATAAAATLSGLLVMNALLKLGAACAAVLAVTLGLWVGGVLPGLPAPFEPAEEPLEVAFRPIERQVAAPPAAAALVPEPARREALRAAPAAAAAESATEEPAPDEATAFVAAVLVDEMGNAVTGGELAAIDGRSASAKSGPDGAARLTLTLDPTPQRVRVAASAPGFASRAEELTIGPGATVDLGELALSPGGTASGRVVDTDGRPVAGVTVTWSEIGQRDKELERMRFEGRERSVPSCTSDADGRFHLVGLAEGFLRLWAHADGMTPSFTAPVEIRGGLETYGVEITMSPLAAEHVIRIIVLDPRGAPVPHAELSYRHRSAFAGSAYAGTRWADGEGRFEFLLHDDAQLSVTARDREGRYGPDSAEDVGTGGPELVLQLTDPVLRELVVKSAGGGPVERFVLEVLASDGSLVHQRLPSEEREGGRARFRVPREAYLVRVTAPGHQIETLGPLPPGVEEPALAASLVPLPGLSGVVWAAGEPAAHVRVALHATVPEDEFYERDGFRSWMKYAPVDETETGEDGRFLLTPREPGSYVVRADADGWASSYSRPFDVGADLATAPVEITLLRGGAIEGRVVPEDDGDPAGTIIGVSHGDGFPRTQRVSSDGSFRFEGLTPGRWFVVRRDQELFPNITTVSSRSGPVAPFSELQWDCEVFEGRTTYHDLRLGSDAPHRFGGRVTVRGRPSLPWMARLVPPGSLDFLDESAPGALIDPAGGFELDAPEPGPYRLVLRAAWEQPAVQFLLDDVTVDGASAGGSPAPWELALRTGVLTVEGLPPSNDAVPEIVLVAEGPGDVLHLIGFEPDDDGTCRVEHAPAGRARLVRPDPATSMDPRDWPVVLPVTIAEGGETRVRVP